eukprot:3106444-Rhodomonas_salina.1
MIKTMHDFGIPVRILCDHEGKWLNLNEMIGATCFDKYDKTKDTETKSTIVGRLTKKLDGIITIKKKAFPGYNKGVWVVSLKQYTQVVQYLALNNKRFQRHADYIMITQTFVRFLAGDQTLHAEINANAASGHILNQMAREEIRHEAEGGRVGGVGNDGSGVGNDDTANDLEYEEDQQQGPVPINAQDMDSSADSVMEIDSDWTGPAINEAAMDFDRSLTKLAKTVEPL